MITLSFFQRADYYMKVQYMDKEWQSQREYENNCSLK